MAKCGPLQTEGAEIILGNKEMEETLGTCLHKRRYTTYNRVSSKNAGLKAQYYSIGQEKVRKESVNLKDDKYKGTDDLHLF